MYFVSAYEYNSVSDCISTRSLARLVEGLPSKLHVEGIAMASGSHLMRVGCWHLVPKLRDVVLSILADRAFGLGLGASGLGLMC